jgi:hypothetical protein
MGIHHKGLKCDVNGKLKELKETISLRSQYFFPKKFELLQKQVSFSKLYHPNGGWSDIRDHLLCKSFVKAENTME